MAVDYFIDYPCEVKNRLSIGVMISLVKQRNNALLLRDMVKRNGKSDEEALKTTFKSYVKTPSGTEMRVQKIADVLEATKQIENFKVFCHGCQASRGRPYGCYGSINYPISAKAEEWLVANVLAELRNKSAGVLALGFIQDQNVDGELISRMRATGNTYLELRQPLDVPVGQIFDKNKVNTDQLLYMILGVGCMKTAHSHIILFLSGGVSYINHEPDPDACQIYLKTTNKDGKDSWLTLNLPDEDTDDRSIAGLKEYFRTMFIAYSLDRELLIDL